MRDGAQSGEGQYAESNWTDLAARASRLGVLIWESGLYIFRRGADIWSAMMYRMFGCFSPELSPGAGPSKMGLVPLPFAWPFLVKEGISALAPFGDEGREFKSGAIISAASENRYRQCGNKAQAQRSTTKRGQENNKERAWKATTKVLQDTRGMV